MPDMIETGTRYVAAGKFGFAGGEGVLKTVVGPGLAMLVHCEQYRCGGLLHLYGYRNRSDNEHQVVDNLRGTLDDFFKELARHRKTMAGCRIELVGGSTLATGTTPRTHNEYTHKKIELASEYARKQRMVIGRIIIGGSAARSVTMDFAAARTVINRVAPGTNRAAADEPPEMAIPMSDEETQRPVTVGTGKMMVARSPVAMSAILGSCVGVALYDAHTEIGGLAHVMTPESPPNVIESSMYADTAVPALIRAMVNLGARRETIEAKIAGGANVLMLGTHETRFRIGERNTVNVLKSLMDNAIPVRMNETGGRRGRKMYVCLRNFDVQVKDIVTEAMLR